MNLDLFSREAHSAIQEGAAVAIEKKNSELTPLHVLYRLIEDDTYSIKKLIDQKSLKILQASLNIKLKNLPTVSEIKKDSIYPSKDLVTLIEKSEKIMKKWNSSYVTTDHLFLALFDIKSAKDLFDEANIKKSEIIEKITSPKRDQDSHLSKYTIDLTSLAAENKLDPVIGRDDEIRRLMQILSRRTKNNPLLIGDPGVGKTAVAEGLAIRIIENDVPQSIQNKKLLTLDMGLLIAGAKFRGEFEERLKNVIKEVEESEGEIILFIDEIHTLVGAGKSDGAMDAANLLKPSLARGKLRCIGATTTKEYKHIEKDKALERRFQTIYLKEPTEIDAIAILRGIKDKYELHHGIKISDEAIIAAVKLSSRYLSDRKLPDKAIDLIDEATSTMKIEMESLPRTIDEINREIIGLKIEKEALLKEDRVKVYKQLENVENRLKEAEIKFFEQKKQWEKEKNMLKEISNLKEEIEDYKDQLLQMQRVGNYNKAAEIQYGKLPEAENRYRELNSSFQSKNTLFIKEEVQAEDIAQIISNWTGIPVKKMVLSEKERIMGIEDSLQKFVVGQDEAIESVSFAIKRSRAGLNDPNKPIASFLFLGPTGVGKTELAKTLTKFLFESEKNLIRVDMSEYMEKHSVSRLIGAPPGYVGYESGGFLTEAIKRNPYSVILFDEIEKAHNDIFNIMLQIFDDGRLTDGHGDTIDFKNTILIMTSNIGSDIIMGEDDRDKIEEDIENLLLKKFKPEFLNRVDELIIFENLDKDSLYDIVDIQIGKLNKTIENQNISISLTEDAKNYIVELGFDPTFGARPLKRVIEHDLKNGLSEEILLNNITSGDKVLVDIEDDEIVYRVSRLASGS